MMGVRVIKTKVERFSTTGQVPQGRHPADIPCHGYQRPFAPRGIESAQQKLAEAHHRFDNAKHGFDGLFAQGIRSMGSAGVASGGGSLKRSCQGR